MNFEALEVKNENCHLTAQEPSPCLLPNGIGSKYQYINLTNGYIRESCVYWVSHESLLWCVVAHCSGLLVMAR